LLVATILAHYVLASIIPIEAITTLIISITLYPLLRTTLLKPTDREFGSIAEVINDPAAAMDSVPATSPSRVP
jgi:cytosine permease